MTKNQLATQAEYLVLLLLLFFYFFYFFFLASSTFKYIILSQSAKK